MVFSSLHFLFLFLPFVLLGYFVVPKICRNVLLLTASLLFYSWGEGIYALLMVFSIVVNWIFGLAIGSRKTIKVGRRLLFIAVIVNLSPLIFFKYTDFFISSCNSLFQVLSIPLSFETFSPHLPIGISFFTFQALSYLVDVYRETSRPQKNLINIGLYISFFPQLIAGPIIRYHDIAKEILTRRITAALFSEGITRFIFGLAKKVLLANPLGLMADTIFSLSAANLSTPVAWLGILCYALQIYFDFSGYSDMAIGLGRMFGFHFLENFNYPYIARSIRDFWKRWHISLSNWFKDYLYIPLGGNRRGTRRTYFNLLSVFALCGLWHGASWNFLLWGLSHGLLMLLERGPAGRLLERAPRIFQHLFLLFFILNTWVFFRIESLSDVMMYFSAMYGLHESSSFLLPVVHLLDGSFFLTLTLAIVLATPLCKSIVNSVSFFGEIHPCPPLSRVVCSAGHILLLSFLLVTSWMYLATGVYNPFIYFRF